MLLVRPLLLSLVLITNTWLLSSVRADALRRYKRAMARRADRGLSSLAGEPCTVSGVWRSRRQPRSVSLSQHRPPVALERTHRSRRGSYSLESAAALCAGACRFESGGTPQAWLEKRSWAGNWSEPVGAVGHYGKQHDSRSAPEEKDFGAARPGPPSAGPLSSSSRSRSPRDLRSVFPNEEEVNSSLLRVVSPDSTTHPPGLKALHALQLKGDGDPTGIPTGILESRSEEDSSGEVEEVDAPLMQPVGNPSPWRSGLPRVPSSWMTALYFGGGQEQLMLNPAAGLELPRGKFSLELWLKPEGGQSNPAVVAGKSRLHPGEGAQGSVPKSTG